MITQISQLLEIKRRREQGIRREIARTSDEMHTCSERLKNLQARQVEARAQWQEAIKQAGVLNVRGLSTLRAQLSRFESEDKRLYAELDNVKQEQSRLHQRQEEQELQLRLILREQEKLKLIEDSL